MSLEEVPADLPELPDGRWDRPLNGRPMFMRWNGPWVVFGPERMVHPGSETQVIRTGRPQDPVPVRCGKAVAQYWRRPGDRWLVCEYTSLEKPLQRRKNRFGRGEFG